MQGKRTHALDSRGRRVPGLYLRDGRYIAGGMADGRWTMHTLDADTLTDARRERDSWLAGLREGRIAAPRSTTVADVFEDWQASRRLSERTLAHERHVFAKRLDKLAHRRVQDVTASDIAGVLRAQRERYSEWSRVQTHRLLSGTFGHAHRRGLIARNPMDGLAPSERPKQRNAKRVARLEPATLATLVDAGSTERWRAALALAGYAGLRLGELRGLRWQDVDLDANLIHVRRSMLPDGTAKAPKSGAGVRDVPLLPALRRLLVAWKVKAPHSQPHDLVIATADGKPIEERNMRRALDDAKTKAKLASGEEERLSLHSLRHSFASMLATDLELPATTLAQLVGHTDAGFTLRAYARDARDTAAVVADVLERAAGAGVAK